METLSPAQPNSVLTPPEFPRTLPHRVLCGLTWTLTTVLAALPGMPSPPSAFWQTCFPTIQDCGVRSLELSQVILLR